MDPRKYPTARASSFHSEQQIPPVEQCYSSRDPINASSIEKREAENPFHLSHECTLLWISFFERSEQSLIIVEKKYTIP